MQVDAKDWMRDKEKRLSNEEARPQIKQASDLMGPGLAPFAVKLSDWSSDEAAFNGIFYSDAGALNSPAPGASWIGTVYATADGRGIQQVRQLGGGAQPQAEYIRGFQSPLGSRVYDAWALIPVPVVGP